MSTDQVRGATLVLFGGTGDLAARKLLPALFNLWEQGRLADSIIVGVGRRSKNRDEYLELLNGRVDLVKTRPDDWKEFAKLIRYHHGDIATTEDFQSLKKSVETYESEDKLTGNRLFYYAVGPEFFAPITERLSEVGLLVNQPIGYQGPWHRVVIEKPFGHDLASAKELDKQLRPLAAERQIYRIDHYLGKETVQNMLAFRFANGLFEPLWNRNYIQAVQITVAESLGVGGRGGYYEEAGALRDMVQNHMLQLLAVTAMEPPIGMDSESLRDEKLKALRAIRVPQSDEEVFQATVIGQYATGTIEGKPVPGYLEEKDVVPGSKTPTFVAARLFLDTWRWANVPFLLRHGKRLAKRGTEIAIQFQTPPLALFRGQDICGHCTNLLVIRIQPNEGIELHFGAKKPGAGMKIANVSMDFEYEKEFDQTIPEAYERLLLDALLGDPTLFTRIDEVMASWRWADRILKGWDSLGDQMKIHQYRSGSWGPSAAESLFPSSDEIPAGVCPVGWRRW